MGSGHETEQRVVPRGASPPEDAGEEAIGPLPGVGVQHSVQVLL